MEKFYKVIKENFLWEVGAILGKTDSEAGYEPIDHFFVKHEDSNEYISSAIVENSPEYFQRVYKVNLVTQVVYEVKDKAKALYERQFAEQK